MDMEAGLEHLARGTAANMDQFIVVVEPGARSIQTYEKVKQLAADIGVTKVNVVANKVRSDEDREYLRAHIPEDALQGFLPYSSDVIDADRNGESPFDYSPELVEEVRRIKQRMENA